MEKNVTVEDFLKTFFVKKKKFKDLKDFIDKNNKIRKEIANKRKFERISRFYPEQFFNI